MFNQTESATFAILLFWVFFRDFFLYFIIKMLPLFTGWSLFNVVFNTGLTVLVLALDVVRIHNL